METDRFIELCTDAVVSYFNSQADSTDKNGRITPDEEDSHEAEKPKIFLSVPMRGRTSEEISEERERLALTAEAFFKEPCDVVDSYFTVDTPEGVLDDKKGIWYLGKALQKMATADVAVFGPRWWDARGCRIEHNICQLYHIPVLELAFDRNPDDTEG